MVLTERRLPPRGFNLGSTQGPVHERAAAKWRTLSEPYGIAAFIKGAGTADVTPLLAQGATVAGLTPTSNATSTTTKRRSTPSIK